MISQDTVIRVFRETAGSSPPEMAAALKTISRSQPELFALAVGLAGGLSEEALSACLVLLITIVRSFEAGSPQPLRAITRRAVVRAFRQNEEVLRTLGELSDTEFAQVADPALHRQPYLFRLVIEIIMEDEERLAPEESCAIFLALKTAIEALDAASRRSRSTPRLKVVR